MLGGIYVWGAGGMGGGLRLTCSCNPATSLGIRRIPGKEGCYLLYVMCSERSTFY